MLFEEALQEACGEVFETMLAQLVTEIERCADECKLEPLELSLLVHTMSSQGNTPFSDVPHLPDLPPSDDMKTLLIDIHFTQSPSNEQLSYNFQSEIWDTLTLKVTKSLVPGFDGQEVSHTAVVSYRAFCEAGEDISTHTFTVDMDKIVLASED